MLILDYFYWHYFIAPGQILVLLKNYSIATWHKFLIVQHARTLFSPWHRMMANVMFKTDTFGDKLGNWVVDIYIRLIAAIIRLTIILTGLIAQVAVALFFLILLIIWYLWPLVFIVSIAMGFVLI